MASHTLNDEEYGNLINSRQDALEEIGRLKAELTRVRAEDPANRLAPLNDLARACIEIVRFAVANLNPESTRGWPTKALERIADLMPALTDANPADDNVFAGELRAFALDCADYALQREQKRQARLTADANAPKGDLAEPAS